MPIANYCGGDSGEEEEGGFSHDGGATGFVWAIEFGQLDFYVNR